MSLKFRLAAAAASLSVLYSSAIRADSLEDVVVTASRVEQPISEVIGSVTVITREQIEQRQSQSLQELLRGEAGVDITNSGGLGKLSAIHLRGANTAQTLILVDGVRLGSATVGATSFEFIPVDQIERIEIVRGPRSSLYGSDAIGGVIQIFTRKHNGLNASASVGGDDTQSYGAGFGMQTDALRFSINGHRQHSDGFNACRNSAGCFTTEPDDDGYRNTSVSARVGYDFGLADLELSTLYSQGYTEFDGSFVNESAFSQSTPNARLHIQVLPTLGITLAGGITNDKSDSFKNGIYRSRFNTEKRTASAQLDWQPGKQQVSVGADYLNDVVDSDTTFDETERDNLGVFAQWLGQIDTHELSASARRDDNEQFGAHNTGNLGWKWFVLERALAINAGWGKAFHAPSFNDLYYPGFSNPLLKPERSQSYELGVSGQQAWLGWSLQLYSTDTTDLIAYNSVAFRPDNISEARLQGAELILNGKWQKLTAGLTYTAQDPRSRAAGPNYDRILARRSRQSGRVDVGYDFGVAQVSTSVYAVGPRYENIANTQRMGGYTLVDLRAEIPLSNGFALQMKLGNALDREYETVRNYNQDGRNLSVTLRYQPGK